MGKVSKRVLHCDAETFSTVNLKKANAYVYFEHPSTDVHCLAWAFDNDEPQLWLPGQPIPEEARAHIESGGELVIWNAQFERLCFDHVLGPKHGWPVPRLEQYICAMAMAYAMALPGGLDMAGPVLGLDHHKDAVGGRIMLQLAKPRKTHADGRTDWYTRGSHPDKFEKLGRYCLQDVRTEQAAYNRLMQLRPQEQKIWRLDQVVNGRGLYIDEALCSAALKVVDAALLKLNAELAKVTDYAVTALSNAAQLTAWVRSKGVVIEGLAKEDLTELLVRDDLPADVRRALEIRQEGAKTSTAKVDKMLSLRQGDGRMRGTLQYHGAATGRWAARGAQIQNFPRPQTKDVGRAIEIMLHGKLEIVEMFYDRPMQIVSDCLRGMIAAAPGHVLFDADFSAIEARVIAWLAGEEKVLRAFREQDAKTGPDVYKVAAAGIYNIKPTAVSDDQRQVGKVAILSLGYQGGPSAFKKMAANYKVDVAAVYDSVWETATFKNRANAQKAWLSRGKASGIGERAWVASELIKLAWRDSNPAIVQLWWDLEAAAIKAVETGEQTHAGRIKFKKAGSWLFCQLPSGRCLTYAYPKIVQKEMPWQDDDGNPVTKPSLVFKGVNGVTRKWEETAYYGGLGSENIVQGISRDLMAEAMLRVEEAGYPVVGTIHDEILCEVPDGFGSLEAFSALMSETPDWAGDLPISVGSWKASRFRK